MQIPEVMKIDDKVYYGSIEYDGEKYHIIYKNKDEVVFDDYHPNVNILLFAAKKQIRSVNDFNTIYTTDLENFAPYSSVLDADLVAYWIIDFVCNTCKITTAQLYSTCRLRYIVEARSIISYILRKYEKMTWTLIGKYLKRNHATIINLYEMCETTLALNQLSTFKLKCNESFKIYFNGNNKS